MSAPLSGQEGIHLDGHPLGFTVQDYWRWSASDLVSNATRGIFAEFLVAKALDIPGPDTREEWAEWDLTTPEGTKVEVKSAAYVQSWEQRRPSSIQFLVPRPKARDGVQGKRPADVYVFALLAHQDKATIDPLNIGQWAFYVLSTRALDARERSQHSITLPSLRALAGGPVGFHDLRDAVAAAVGRPAIREVLVPMAPEAVSDPCAVDAFPEESGPWRGRIEDQAGKAVVFIESADFTHDARLYVDGDFPNVRQKAAYAHEIARRLNGWVEPQKAEQT
ncbi:MAG TPA: hypothetical protein VFF77_02510 [Holophagaceae bacterium]|jgi:hypothetical protein|nr:hypothetical protein [Holophagaceae bacterium]